MRLLICMAEYFPILLPADHRRVHIDRERSSRRNRVPHGAPDYALVGGVLDTSMMRAQSLPNASQQDEGRINEDPENRCDFLSAHAAKHKFESDRFLVIPLRRSSHR